VCWVGVPAEVMDEQTFPERVSSLNYAVLRAKVLRGGEHADGGGALYVKCQTPHGEVQKVLRGRTEDERRAIADALQVGDIVERQFVEGDVCLVNRQPTLREHSIMAAFMWRNSGSTLILPLAIMGPFNAGQCRRRRLEGGVTGASSLPEALADSVPDPHSSLHPPRVQTVVSCTCVWTLADSVIHALSRALRSSSATSSTTSKRKASTPCLLMDRYSGAWLRRASLLWHAHRTHGVLRVWPTYCLPLRVLVMV
jgi:hypothetical protein